MSRRSYHGELGGGRPNTRSGRRLFPETTPSTTPTNIPQLQHTPSTHPNSSTHSTLPTHPTAFTQVTPSTHLTPSIDSNASSDPSSTDALSQTASTSVAQKKKGRGPTTRTVTDKRKPGDARVKVNFWNGKALEQEYVTSIGVWVRTYSIFPPNVRCFNDGTREAKEKLYTLIDDNFEFVKEYEELNGASSSSHESVPAPQYVPSDPQSDPLLIIPASPEIRKMIKSDCRGVFYRHMLDLRKKNFYPFKTNAERLQKVPHLMHPDHWSFLVEYWSSSTFQEMSETNAANGAKNVMLHTLGSRPVALIRKKSLEEKGHVDEVDIFDATHINKKGEYISEEAANASSLMKEMKTQHTLSDGSCSLTSHEILTEVRGSDWKERKRGRGGRFIEAPRRNYKTRAELEAEIRAEIRSEAISAAQEVVANFMASLPQHVRDQIPPLGQRDGEDEP